MSLTLRQSTRIFTYKFINLISLGNCDVLCGALGCNVPSRIRMEVVNPDRTKQSDQQLKILINEKLKPNVTSIFITQDLLKKCREHPNNSYLYYHDIWQINCSALVLTGTPEREACYIASCKYNMLKIWLRYEEDMLDAGCSIKILQLSHLEFCHLNLFTTRTTTKGREQLGTINHEMNLQLELYAQAYTFGVAVKLVSAFSSLRTMAQAIVNKMTLARPLKLYTIGLSCIEGPFFESFASKLRFDKWISDKVAMINLINARKQLIDDDAAFYRGLRENVDYFYQLPEKKPTPPIVMPDGSRPASSPACPNEARKETKAIISVAPSIQCERKRREKKENEKQSKKKDCITESVRLLFKAAKEIYVILLTIAFACGLLKPICASETSSEKQRRYEAFVTPPLKVFAKGEIYREQANSVMTLFAKPTVII